MFPGSNWRLNREMFIQNSANFNHEIVNIWVKTSLNNIFSHYLMIQQNDQPLDLSTSPASIIIDKIMWKSLKIAHYISRCQNKWRLEGSSILLDVSKLKNVGNDNLLRYSLF